MVELPLLLVGGTMALGSPLLPLAQPMYFLAPPDSAPYAGQCHGLVVGGPEHQAILSQWLQGVADLPHNPVFGQMKQGIKPQQEGDASWRRLRELINNPDAAPPPSSPDNREDAILLFLLLARLDSLAQSNDQVFNNYLNAQNALLANLDQEPDKADTLFLNPGLSPERRMAIWGRAASLLELPRTVWTMRDEWLRPWLAMWQPAYEAQAALSLPGCPEILTIECINALRNAIYGLGYDTATPLARREQQLAGVWRQTLDQLDQPLRGMVHFYWLPQAARSALLNRPPTGTDDDFLCITWHDD